MSLRRLRLIIVACLALRALTLEYPDLVDPTESRYAFVGQEMYLSGDWVVPKLPWQGVVEPYLGKPPLHFWLTATSIAAFGMDEWVVRLPSFLALLVVLASVFYLRRFDTFSKSAPLAALITTSSTLMYFMSGASVVDVTLTSWMTVAFIGALVLLKTRSPLASLALFIGLGLAFLTKGPIALALIGLPAAAWVLITGRYDAIKLPKWGIGLAAFALVTVPWFWMAQLRNSDFLRYFFINENFGRYLLDDYGDRYGSGHRYPWGAIWWMYALGFFPWTIPFLLELLKQRKVLFTKSYWRTNEESLFLALWTLSPLFIFTFAKQVNPAYVLPGLPGLALLASQLITGADSSRRFKTFQILSVFMVILGVVGGLIGVFLGAVPFHLIVGIIPLLLLVLIGIQLKRGFSSPELFGFATVAAFALTNLSLANKISEKSSSKSILECLTHYEQSGLARIGIVNANAYSLYFYSRAWSEELAKPIAASFYRDDNLPSDLPDDLLVRRHNVKDIKKVLPDQYQLILSSGRWSWLRRGAPLSVSHCPSED